ncbi:hypothetical protein [Mucilaginibacter psychrotolerans]|uniref:Bacillithiol biosynthesis BshC n=1 Tax=Mucilaginibacter psychrotolerans TaxID=1524096 RepID=A0A4Y8SBD9_9SPHI|nr:hypothetical protein [Mucilaginibacter psychrotolerans]TFF36202.1 hypothetical protein E2R66_16815 [Mucilaginibacter psychrotolerans]
MLSHREALLSARRIEKIERGSNFKFVSDSSEFVENFVGLTKSHVASTRLSPHQITKIKRFHEKADLLSNDVKKTLTLLEDTEYPIVRIFHQPNTLIGLNIFGLIIAAQELCSKIEKETNQKPVVLFLFMDYDVAEDKSFRSPRLPNWHSNKTFYLPGAVKRDYRRRIASSLAKPDESEIQKWIESLRQSSNTCFKKLNEIDEFLLTYRNKEEQTLLLKESFNRIYASANSLVEANANFIAWLSNRFFNYSTLFVSATELLESSFERMVEIFEKDFFNNVGQSNYPITEIWAVCEICNERSRLAIANQQYNWICKCGNSSFFDKLSYKVFEAKNGFSLPTYYPNVHLCDLLEIYSYGLRVGVSYAGSIDHMITSRSRIIEECSTQILEFIWEPDNLFSKEKIRKVAIELDEVLIGDFIKGKYPILFYLQLYGKEHLVNIIRQSI